jgi:hypothetical protein
VNKSIVVLFGLLLPLIFSVPVYAAPWEVLSDISYIRKGGLNAARLDFAIPVHYVSHFPVKHGSTLTINLRFDKNEVADTSELPLLQTIKAPKSLLVPLKDVTYMTESGEPKLVVNFREDVEFSVSQVMGISNLIIFFPETHEPKPKIVEPELRPVEREIASAGEKVVAEDKVSASDNEKAKKILDEGRAALRQGDNKKAIQTFATLLSMPKHVYMQPSLELLGLSRERNNQAAQAKAVYEEYLKLYPKGDGAIRVNQRLAELISNQMKPRKRLKETKTRKEEKQNYTSEFYGNFGQYYDYSATRTTSQPLDTNVAILENQMYTQWRVRYRDYDIRNVIYANYDYDTSDHQTDGLEINSLYSQMKNRKLGVNATVGRQRAAVGVLGKFDGVLLGYALQDKVHANLVAGFPMDYSDKQNIQTDQPFLGMSFELNDYWKGWDISPYVIRQNVDGHVDREAVGTEVRYFEEFINFFGLLDYDIYFNDINIFLFNGQYNVKKDTAITFGVDHRKSPVLETGNALVSLSENTTLSDIVRCLGRDPCDLRSLAEDRTGHSTTVTLGLSHAYSSQLTMTGDVAYSRFNFKTVNPAVTTTDQDFLDTPSTGETDTQKDYTFQVVASELLDKRDTSISYIRLTQAEKYNEATASAAYRRPFKSWRTHTQLQVRKRANDNGENLLRIIPSLKLEYRIRDDWQFYIESSLEFWNYSGTTANEDSETINVFMGYNYNF